MAAFENGEIVGVALFYCNDYENYMSYLSSLCVSKAFRGCGIAKDLVNNMINEAAKQGMKKVFLFVHKDNSSAIALYKKCGFEISDDICANAEYSITMIKSIGE